MGEGARRKTKQRKVTLLRAGDVLEIISKKRQRVVIRAAKGIEVAIRKRAE